MGAGIMRKIIDGDIYTREELKQLSLVNTKQSFGDLLIYARGKERFLLEKVGGKRFSVYLKYNHE